MSFFKQKINKENDIVRQKQLEINKRNERITTEI